MTRDDIIEHVAGVAATVFRAENAIRPQWEKRLRQTKGAAPETKEETANAYLHAVAEEILKGYSDDELQRLYPDALEN